MRSRSRESSSRAKAGQSLCVSFGGLRRNARTATPVALDHDLHRSFGVVGHKEEVDVLRRDHPLRQQFLSHPFEQLAPVVAVEEDDREVENLSGLDQRQRLEQLVDRAEAAGKDDKTLRGL